MLTGNSQFCFKLTLFLGLGFIKNSLSWEADQKLSRNTLRNTNVCNTGIVTQNPFESPLLSPGRWHMYLLYMWFCLSWVTGLSYFHSLQGRLTYNYDHVNNHVHFIGMLFFFVSNFLFIYFFTLQYCSGFAIYQHASAMGVHVFPILNPPPTSPYHHSGSSQRTSPKHPVSCIEPGLAIHFLYDIIHVSMPFSQIIPPSPSPTESKRLFCTSVSLLLSHI